MEDIKKETEQLDPDQSKRCLNCGAIWQHSHVCEHCGNTRNILFCPSCGTKL